MYIWVYREAEFFYIPSVNLVNLGPIHTFLHPLFLSLLFILFWTPIWDILVLFFFSPNLGSCGKLSWVSSCLWSSALPRGCGSPVAHTSGCAVLGCTWVPLLILSPCDWLCFLLSRSCSEPAPFLFKEESKTSASLDCPSAPLASCASAASSSSLAAWLTPAFIEACSSGLWPGYRLPMYKKLVFCDKQMTLWQTPVIWFLYDWSPMFLAIRWA